MMDLNENEDNIRVIKEILERKEKIANNPFSNLPTSSLEKALALLEEYSEEISTDSLFDQLYKRSSDDPLP